MARMWLVLLLIATPTSLQAQSFLCELRATSSSEIFKGMCRASADSIEIELRFVTDRDSVWRGTITRGMSRNDFELVDTPYPTAVRKVLRSQIEWVLTTGWTRSDSMASFRFNVEDVAPPTEDDIAILLRAHEVIAEGEWDRNDDRDCENDVGARISLYCALARATKERMGRYHHRQPALRLVREYVAERWPERIKGHRLMDFNNDPRTSFADVDDVLSAALQRARAEVAGGGESTGRAAYVRGVETLFSSNSSLYASAKARVA